MDDFWLNFWSETWDTVKSMALGAFVYWLLFVAGKKQDTPRNKGEN